MRVKKFIKLT